MKLIFLGDSFTYGYGLDVEEAINRKYIEFNNDLFFKYPKFNSLINEEQKKELKIFIEDNVWVKKLSNKLNLKYINLSIPGSSMQGLNAAFLQHELFNSNKDNIYLFFLPVTKQARLLISSSNNGFFLNLFKNYTFFNEKEDINKFKRKFDKKYFYVIYLNSLMNLIFYLKNNNIKFMLLPTWENNIYNHFFDDHKVFKKNFFINLFNINNINKTEETIFNLCFENFIFDELPSEQLYFNFNKKIITTLPCKHPDLKSQPIIADLYYDHIKSYIDSFS
jgi:hypothetical protein